eukprot:594327-Pleurochrysis_carterae.AAC.3
MHTGHIDGGPRHDRECLSPGLHASLCVGFVLVCALLMHLHVHLHGCCAALAVLRQRARGHCSNAP